MGQELSKVVTLWSQGVKLQKCLWHKSMPINCLQEITVNKSTALIAVDHYGAFRVRKKS